MFWFTISVIGLWFGVAWAFVGVMHAKVLYERGDLGVFWLVTILPLAIVGLLLDFVFNQALGWLIFGRWPWHRWRPLFTSRVKWERANASGWRLKVAMWWQRQLNRIDAGHV